MAVVPSFFLRNWNHFSDCCLVESYALYSCWQLCLARNSRIEKQELQFLIVFPIYV